MNYILMNLIINNIIKIIFILIKAWIKIIQIIYFLEIPNNKEIYINLEELIYIVLIIVEEMLKTKKTDKELVE